MELRSCSNLHYIQAITAGTVTKHLNIDCRGKPTIVIKKLEDIYEHTDAKGQDISVTPKLGNGLVFDLAREKPKSLNLHLAERETRVIDPDERDYNCDGSDNEMPIDLEDPSFIDMTLKQLKERCKTRKRRASEFVGLSPKQECTDIRPEEDEIDLEEPLGVLKLKISEAKRKCCNKSATSFSKMSFSVKSEPILFADNLQCNVVNLPITVKAEVTDEVNLPITVEAEVTDEVNLPITVEAEITDEVNLPITMEAEVNDEVNLPITVKAELLEPDYVDNNDTNLALNDSTISFGEQEEFCQEDSSQASVMVDCELGTNKPEPGAGDFQTCVTNLACHNLFLSPLREPAEVEHEQDAHQQPSLLSTLESKEEQNTNYFQNSKENSKGTVSSPLSSTIDVSILMEGCCDLREISNQFVFEDEVRNSNMEIDNCCIDELAHNDGSCTSEQDASECLSLNLENRSLNDTVCSSSSCLSNDNDFFYKTGKCSSGEEQLLESSATSSGIVCLDFETQCVISEKDSQETEGTQQFATIEVGNNPSSVNNTCVANSTSEIRCHSTICQPPERLFLTKRAISPTSHERLSLSINSAELCDDDTDNYMCKENLFLEKKTGDKVPTDVSNKDSESSGDSKGPLQVTTTKITLISREMLSRQKCSTKLSPTKRNSPKRKVENLYLSRSLPHFSTRCTSIRECSDSAIAFSQRQVQDMERVVWKLMTELNFMKDMVEQKLLYAAYRSTLKNNTDEVKIALQNASKAKKSAKKWLDQISRDSKRFCKIMELTENGRAASENVVQKGRKISFADEAGGMLCHVKVFEDDMGVPTSQQQDAKDRF